MKIKRKEASDIDALSVSLEAILTLLIEKGITNKNQYENVVDIILEDRIAGYRCKHKNYEKDSGGNYICNDCDNVLELFD